MSVRKSPTPESVVPDHSCRALEALRPFITDEALQLAADRLGMTDEKVSLLIVLAINPHERLTIQEQAILNGVTRKTMSKLIQEERRQ